MAETGPKPSSSAAAAALHGRRVPLRALVLFAAFFVIGAGAVILYRQTGGIELVRLSALV